MKFSALTSFALASALVAASPMPKVKFVTVTSYTTINVNHADYTNALTPAADQQALPPAPTDTFNPYDEPAEDSPAEDSQAEDSQADDSQADDSPVQDSPAEAPTENAPAEAPTDNAPAEAPTENTPAEAPTENAPSESNANEGSSSTGSIGAGETFSGKGTFYEPEMGACGQKNNSSEPVVAMNYQLFDKYTPNGNPNKNSLCGRKLNAHYEGKTVQLTVVDRCGACGEGGLDLTPTSFAQLADKDLGHIQLTWEWAS